MKDQITQVDQDNTWKVVGLVILSIRFVQGWIFWGGGSRRFIYDPSKLDPYSTQWMANKLQSAIPGTMLGIGHIVSFLLQHFVLLYTSIILFSLFELVCGLSLLSGFITRLAGFGTALISIILMLLFGWQGATCMDEWTMAAANLSMGLTLALSGGSIYSVDHWLFRRYPGIARKWWYHIFASSPWPYIRLKRLSLIFLSFTVLFTLMTYNYLRGSILTPYHAGPVSVGEDHLQPGKGQLTKDGMVSFLLYVNAGTSSVPTYIIRIELLDHKGDEIETWKGKDLSKLPAGNIKNVYQYNRISTGPYGIVAPLSAKAVIDLPPAANNLKLTAGDYQLRIYVINGERYNLAIQFS